MPYYVKLGIRGPILTLGTKIISYIGAIKYRRMRRGAGVPAPLGLAAGKPRSRQDGSKAAMTDV